MIRVEIEFNASEAQPFTDRLGREPGIPAAHRIAETTRRDHDGRYTVHAGATVVTIDVEDEAAIGRIEALLVEVLAPRQQTATVTTFPLTSKKTITGVRPEAPEASKPMNGPARFEAEGRAYNPRELWTAAGMTEDEWHAKLQADRDDMAEKARLRQEAEAQKRALLEQLQAETKAKQAAQRAARQAEGERQARVDAMEADDMSTLPAAVKRGKGKR